MFVIISEQLFTLVSSASDHSEDRKTIFVNVVSFLLGKSPASVY